MQALLGQDCATVDPQGFLFIGCFLNCDVKMLRVGISAVCQSSCPRLIETLQSLSVLKVFAAPPRGDRPAQEAQAQEHCAVPRFCQPGWFHQDLYGRSARR